RLTDLMPVQRRTESSRGYDVGSTQRLLRLVEALDDDVDLEIDFKPTFEYARTTTSLRLVTAKGAVAQAGDRFLSLACPDVPFESTDDGTVRARVRLRAGERR